LLPVKPDTRELLCVIVGEKPVAPIAAAAAAIRNNEQRMGRHGDGVNVDVEVGVVLIEYRALI
jgi:hypothetical protein